MCGFVAVIFLYIEVGKKDHTYDTNIQYNESCGSFGTHGIYASLIENNGKNIESQEMLTI